MTRTSGRLLKWGAAAAVTALAVVLVLHPVVPTSALGGRAPSHGALLMPMAAGLVLIAVVTDRHRSRELDRRARAALEGHSMPYELTCLMLLLAVFLLATVGVSFLGQTFLPTVSWEVLMPPIRILLLFVLPLVVVDMGGFTVAGYSTVMPLLAMRVTEGWRWAGAVPVCVTLALMALAVFPAPMPDPALVIAAAIAIVAAVAVPEELFFRALVQTRLERVAGRWPGILLATALFTVVSVYLSEYGELSTEAEVLEFGVWQAGVFYAMVGLLHGLLWSAYRNFWLNVLMRSGALLIRVAPALQVL
ncbi:CPBP family intramembrane glutamic endopeptidase [Streptomonospora litoralis]|uniref:CAAX prenyl protease 2/Lysostaphin resistance protein A-like domain-containing protein n=1 Tax=Streptomonospora litoralis TaxID=2498135 RepID=A0A4P6Q0W7_9ACTN|nr:CPBP family intramembrane glutamic endopeptidase [Streptomonospora litoralis]QBI52344.1 hypothetical protein EKD16_02640 [Streptomonospora litoralis]